MSIANTQADTIIQAGIIDDNDQVLARVEHLKALETLVGNSYPNKFERSRITGKEDTISNILAFAPVSEIAKELKDNTPEGEKPDQELKAQLNEKLTFTATNTNLTNSRTAIRDEFSNLTFYALYFFFKFERAPCINSHRRIKQAL